MPSPAHPCNILECDIYHALDAIKGRWHSVVIYALRDGKHKYNEIAQQFSFLSATQLTRTLSTLRTHGIIEKVEGGYALTEKSENILPILDALSEWQQKFKKSSE